MAQPILNVTELDFDQIKSNLKAYFQRQESPFTDWDFEGSGLSMLLDVLAYNTQYNAMLAHLTLNESFIDTAQLRSSVVSQAKLLGYVPGSITASMAKLNVVFTANSASAATTLTVPRGTQFTTTVDGVSYTFVTTESTTSSLSSSGTYSFTLGVTAPSNCTAITSTSTLQDTTQTWVANSYVGYSVYILSGAGAGQTGIVTSNTSNTFTFATPLAIPADTTSTYVILAAGSIDLSLSVREGTLRKMSYPVDNSTTNQKFVIDDLNADISTLKVLVYDYANSSSYSVFSPFSSLSGTDGNSQVYFISQNVQGKFEVTFGNGTFGQALDNLNVVTLEFVSTSGTSANGASIFTFASDAIYSNGIAITTGSPTISTLISSIGGAQAETIESIRFNAPNSLITQNRAVTANDYRSILLNNFGYIESLNVWGGEDEVQYDPLNAGLYAGQAYISIKQIGTDSPLSSSQQLAITNLLETKRVMTIKTNFVNPDYTYLYVNAYFKYSPNLTAEPSSTLQANVLNIIQNYSTNNLERFDGVFRHSNVLNQIDTSDPAILNSDINVFFYKSYTINPLGSTNLGFLASGKLLTSQFSGTLNGTVNQTDLMISSDPWVWTPTFVSAGTGSATTLTLTGSTSSTTAFGNGANLSLGILNGTIVSGTNISHVTSAYGGGAGTTNLTGLSTTNILVGMAVSGTGISSGTFVTATNGTSTATLSQACGSGTSGTLTFTGALVTNVVPSTGVITTSQSNGSVPAGTILTFRSIGPKTLYLKDGDDVNSTSTRLLYASTTATGIPVSGTDIVLGVLDPALGKLTLSMSEKNAGAISGTNVAGLVTVTDAGKVWSANGYPIGNYVYITSGTGIGSYGQITANTSTSFSFTPTVGFVPDSTTTYQIFTSGISADSTSSINIYSEPASNDVAPKRNQILEIDLTKSSVTPSIDTIAVAGSAGINSYTTFPHN